MSKDQEKTAKELELAQAAQCETNRRARARGIFFSSQNDEVYDVRLPSGCRLTGSWLIRFRSETMRNHAQVELDVTRESPPHPRSDKQHANIQHQFTYILGHMHTRSIQKYQNARPRDPWRAGDQMKVFITPTLAHLTGFEHVQPRLPRRRTWSRRQVQSRDCPSPTH